jgi:HK97 family phage major capsid protein
MDEKSILKKRALEIIDACRTEIRNFNQSELDEFNDIKYKIYNINEELLAIDNVYSSDNNINTNIKRNKTMEKSFSLIKAIRSVSNNKAMDALESAVVEAGASEMRKAGLNYVGQIQLPSTETRAITVANEGEDVVATDLMDIVKPLHARNVLVQAGAKFVTGLVGDLQYPVMSAVNTTWEGETASAKDGSPTFTNVKMSPKRLTAVVPISKQFIVQDSVGAENAIREEIINAINAKLESTILGNAAGSATQPEGLFYSTEALPTVADFASLTNLEGEVEEANVYGEMKYIVAPKAKAALRNMAKSTKSTQLVYEGGEIDGTPALSTSNIKGKNLVYGDFSNYIIGQWGNIDITVDNVTLAAEGQIRLVVNCYFDAKPLRKEAFKVATIA